MWEFKQKPFPWLYWRHSKYSTRCNQLMWLGTKLMFISVWSLFSVETFGMSLYHLKNYFWNYSYCPMTSCFSEHFHLAVYRLQLLYYKLYTWLDYISAFTEFLTLQIVIHITAHSTASKGKVIFFVISSTPDILRPLNSIHLFIHR